MVTPPSETRLGRTALIVLAISLSMCGALLALERFGPKDEYDQGVLKILAITVGVVGSIWAFVLLVRGVVRGESMVVPFVIFLIVFAGLSVPLIQTWDTEERGSENGLYFFHFACVSLFVPLVTIAFLFATPLFAWKYWRAGRSEEALRAGLKWRAWRALFLAAGVFFAAVFPVSFYIYGGTMAARKDDWHWTTKVVQTLPRRLGDFGYRVLEVSPVEATDTAKALLVTRGLVSAGFLTGSIEELKRTGNPDVFFSCLTRHYSTEALEFVCKHFNHYPPTIQSRAMAGHFAQFASDADVRGYLTPERFNVLELGVKIGFGHGLLLRENIKDFVPDAEKLWDGEEALARVMLNVLMRFADEPLAKRVYLDAIGRNTYSIQSATSFLLEIPRGAVIAAAISQPDMIKQQRALQALLTGLDSRQSYQALLVRNERMCRMALLRGLDTPDIDNRVMTALIIHQLSAALSTTLIQKYRLNNYSPLPLSVTPAQLRAVDLAERNVLVAQARDLMRKW